MAAVGTLTPGVVTREVVLHYLGGSSDKLYRLQRVVSSDGATYDVTAWNCRRGSHYISQGFKCRGVNVAHADSVIASVVSEKTQKGYKIINDSSNPATPGRTTPATPAPPPAPKAPVKSSTFAGVPAANGVVPKPTAKLGMSPVRAALVTDEDLLSLLSDPNVAMHGTLGGVALVIGAEQGRAFGVDSDGYEATLPPSLLAALATLGTDFAIEGELVDGVFHAWDIRKVEGRDVRALSFTDRRFELTYLLCGRTVDASVIKPVFVEDSGDKTPFFFMLQDEGAKSVVFRDLVAEGTSPEGKPRASMFSSEIVAFVCGVVGNGRRVEVALHPVTNAHPGYSHLPVEWRGLPVEMTLTIGFVDLPDGQARPKIGGIVRLAYEAILPTKGGNQGLRFLGVVEDGKDEDCHIGQIRF